MLLVTLRMLKRIHTEKGDWGGDKSAHDYYNPCVVSNEVDRQAQFIKCPPRGRRLIGSPNNGLPPTLVHTEGRVLQRGAPF